MIRKKSATRGQHFKKLASMKAPTLPSALKGQSGRGGLATDATYAKWVDARNAFALKAMKANIPLEEVAAMFQRMGHPISASGIQQSLVKKGLVPSTPTGPRNPTTRMPKLAKHNREDAVAMMGFLDELVEKRLAPINRELQRLTKVEKQYNALVKATRLLADVTTEDQG